MSRTLVPYTKAELERAIRLRRRHLEWSEIAQILQRDQNGLEATVCKYRKGRWAVAGRAERTKRIESVLDNMVADGATLEEMGAEIGIKPASVMRRLYIMGYTVSQLRSWQARRIRRAA